MSSAGNIHFVRMRYGKNLVDIPSNDWRQYAGWQDSLRDGADYSPPRNAVGFLSRRPDVSVPS